MTTDPDIMEQAEHVLANDLYDGAPAIATAMQSIRDAERAKLDLAIAEREFWRTADRKSIERAEAAEARIAELTKTLERISSYADRTHADRHVIHNMAESVLNGGEND